MDINATLNSLLGAYTTVSKVRADASVAKYNAAATTQQAMLNAPQGYTASEAYAVGNARVNGAVPMGVSASIPKELIYGGLGLGALLIAWKVLK